jgi:hypothetical protein
MSNRSTLRSLAPVVVCLVALVAAGAPDAPAAATLVLNNVDPPGVGLDAPTVTAPVGGNPGTTLGEQREIVLRFAADLWGSMLRSDSEIVVQVSFRALPCSAGSALLASSGAVRALADFPGAEFAGTWYPPALANKLAGYDLTPGAPDPGLLAAPFNDDVYLTLNVALDDDPACLGGVGWYYGLDNQAGSAVDLLNVMVHEMAHGLGFANFVDEATGTSPGGLPDVYSRYTYDTVTGRHWHEMTATERVASSRRAGQVVWDGPHVTAQAPFVLGPRPVLQVMPPSAMAGDYEVTAATFGPAPSEPGVAGELALAYDGAGATSDACEPLAGDYAGTIVVTDRGSCTFVAKAANAQAAGAAGVVVVNNDPVGLPPMTGQDPSIVIPAVGLSLADGQALKAALPGLDGVIGVDPLRLAGADDASHVRLLADGRSGSAISHWDLTATPNLLMEPVFAPDLRATETVDLTTRLLADIGWDECPASNFSPAVLLGSCDPGVPNQVLDDGCTIADRIGACAVGVDDWDDRCVRETTRTLVDLGVLDNQQRVAVERCARNNKPPHGKPFRPAASAVRGTPARGRGTP